VEAGCAGARRLCSIFSSKNTARCMQDHLPEHPKDHLSISRSSLAARRKPVLQYLTFASGNLPTKLFCYNPHTHTHIIATARSAQQQRTQLLY
jgi:hypothetical protein